MMPGTPRSAEPDIGRAKRAGGAPRNDTLQNLTHLQQGFLNQDGLAQALTGVIWQSAWIGHIMNQP